MVDVDVLGVERARGGPSAEEVRSLCERVADAFAIGDAHVAVEFVGEQRIAALNARHRGRPRPTDVLSFPIDGAGPSRAGTGSGEGVPLELGDIVICPARTADLREAIIHGMLHLLGMDHESDDGEMLALQDRLLARAEP